MPGTPDFNRQYDPELPHWAISIHLYGASPEIKDLYHKFETGRAECAPVAG